MRACVLLFTTLSPPVLSVTNEILTLELIMNDHTSEPPLLTVKQAAKRLAVSEKTIYAQCQSGELACHRIGLGRGTIRLSEAQLADYLANRKPEPTDERPPPKSPGTSFKHLKV